MKLDSEKEHVPSILPRLTPALRKALSPLRCSSSEPSKGDSESSSPMTKIKCPNYDGNEDTNQFLKCQSPGHTKKNSKLVPLAIELLKEGLFLVCSAKKEKHQKRNTKRLLKNSSRSEDSSNTLGAYNNRGSKFN